jgi:Domain of unknown function (DUF4124)
MTGLEIRETARGGAWVRFLRASLPALEFDEVRLPTHDARVSRAAPWTLVILMLAGPRLADAAIYGWHDAQGVAHYVSDPENVPSEYRARAVTVVKNVPVPAAPSSQEPTARVETSAPVALGPTTDQVVETAFERGYRAGLDLSAATAVDPGPWVSSIVQNVQIIESPPLLPAFISPSPFFGPILGMTSRFHARHRFLPKGGPALGRTRRFHARHRFLPRGGGRFIQGPAGPPPLGAPGPPPVSFSRH